MYQIFSFSNINKTQRRAMNLNDLLNVESYSDNLKMFTQAWGESLMALSEDVDEDMLGSLYLYQSDTALNKEPRSNQKLSSTVNDNFEEHYLELVAF